MFLTATFLKFYHPDHNLILPHKKSGYPHKREPFPEEKKGGAACGGAAFGKIGIFDDFSLKVGNQPLSLLRSESARNSVQDSVVENDFR